MFILSVQMKRKYLAEELEKNFLIVCCVHDLQFLLIQRTNPEWKPQQTEDQFLKTVKNQGMVCNKCSGVLLDAGEHFSLCGYSPVRTLVIE